MLPVSSWSSKSALNSVNLVWPVMPLGWASMDANGVLAGTSARSPLVCCTYALNGSEAMFEAMKSVTVRTAYSVAYRPAVSDGVAEGRGEACHCVSCTGVVAVAVFVSPADFLTNFSQNDIYSSLLAFIENDSQ